MRRISDHPRYTSTQMDGWRHRIRMAAADLPDAVVLEIIRVAGPQILSGTSSVPSGTVGVPSSAAS